MRSLKGESAMTKKTLVVGFLLFVLIGAGFAEAVGESRAPIYHFWSGAYGHHFYTISESDKNYVIATWPDIWTYEGPVFYAYPNQVPGTLPVYCFWSAKFGGHFYTISEGEKDYVITTWPDIWTYEGIAYYSPSMANVPVSPPDGLPQGYETWAVVYKIPNRRITIEQKLNADFWKQNLTDPIPPIWWFNEVLGRSYPESSPYYQQIADAKHSGDWATELELKQKYINELGITADEQSEVTRQWLVRNPYHNLSYFALGVTDKKTRTFMSNQNPDDPFSPFAKEGENIMVVEVLEDNVSGIMELTDLDIAKIGLFEAGITVFGGEDYIRKLVKKAQKAKFFIGVSWHENGLESYYGWKVGGMFGLALRK
jgi:hypothetical protein